MDPKHAPDSQDQLLQHDAELILSLFGDTQAQQQRLLAIEKQLDGMGAPTATLHRQIERLAQQSDPDQYRCRYDPLIT